jgi:hypothetical protein
MKVENLPRFINEFNKQVKTIESLTAERDYWKRLAEAALDIVNDESLTIQAWHLEKFQRLKSVEEGGK